MTPTRKLPIFTLAAAAALALSPALLGQTTGTGSTETGSHPAMGTPSNPTPADRNPDRDRAMGVGATSTSTSSNTNAANSGVSAADRAFARKAAQDGLAEVELGRLAADKASSDEVKSFGRQMVDDHQKANDELKQIAQSKGIDLPADTDSGHKAKMSKLQKLSGADFDRAYVKDMVKDHKKDVKLFEKEADKGKDPELKQFAQKTVTTLHEHHQKIDQIASTIGVKGGKQLPAAGNTGDTSTGDRRDRETGTAKQGAGASAPNPTP